MQPERSTVTRIRAFVKGIKCCNASSHPASHWPVWAHIPLPFCPEWFHRKDKLELCACFLVFRWSLSAVASHTWDTWGESPYFADPSVERDVQKASQLLCWGERPALKTKYQILLLHLKDCSVGEPVTVEWHPRPDYIRSPQKFMQGPWHANNLVVDD